ncbi:MAG: ATP-binding protein [Desulfobacterium sp.]|nr:ATP-binding protein [Desulfobacteraceae bacterium]MBA3037940.1 ATP-binding protein [Desulfobacterium sp.]
MKPRNIFQEIEKYLGSPEAIIITGMRRTGKTTLLRFISEKIASKNKIILDFENPINRKYFETDNYESIKTALEIMGLSFKNRPFIFLDEIQFVKQLPSVIKYFIDHYQVKFFLTGSASYYLRNLFTESLAGRKYIFELFPLSFKEFLVFKEIDIRLPEGDAVITKPIYDLIAPLYDEYMLFGGFPGVVLKDNAEEKARALDDIFSSYFQLEVLQLGDFRRNDTIRDLILLLAQRIGSKLDMTKLSKELGVSRATLAGYVSFLEGTYFIRTIRPFSQGKDTEIRKMPKVYFCDTGMANQLARLDTGALFENTVFLNLSFRGEVAYYQKKSGVEIDFIVERKQGYEVKVSSQVFDIRRLKGLSEELGLERSGVVSKNFNPSTPVTYGFMV